MKALFIIGTLDSGGVAKSIVNLLSAIERTHQEVHLLVMSAGDGPFAQYIPEEVIVHRNPVSEWLLGGLDGVISLLKHGHLLLALGSLLRMVLTKIDKPSAGWLLGHLYPTLEGEWDIIVDYNGQQQLYYMVDKLKGKKKITFFHSDYKKWPYYERMDRRYFPKVDCICTISPQCVESLKAVFPEVADKVQLFENISLPSMIYRLAEEPIESLSLSGTVLLTIGHVCYNKGIDLALDAGLLLKEKGIVFTWMFVGGTKDASEYIAQLNDPTSKSHPLRESFVFLGIQSNPYKYMKRADIIVHPSRFEGKSIALDEAKILCKPIVVTDFSTVHDQFEDGINATICQMNGESLSEAIIDLIENKDRQAVYARFLLDEIKEIELTNPLQLLEI